MASSGAGGSRNSPEANESQPVLTVKPVFNIRAIETTLNTHGRELTQHMDAYPTIAPVVDSIRKNLDYHVYHQRMQDGSEIGAMGKGRRRKVLHFIANKAEALFAADEVPPRDNRDVLEARLQEDNEHYAIMPPVERFMDVSRSARKESLFEILAEGDLIVGKVCSLQSGGGFHVLLQALEPPKSREIWDLNIRGLVQPQDLIVLGEGPLKGYKPDDWVRCEVAAVDKSNYKILLGMQGNHAPQSLLHQLNLGQLSEKSLIDCLPKSYVHAMESEVGDAYNDLLEDTPAFHNPRCVDPLCQQFGIDRTKVTTLMSSRRVQLPEESTKDHLRARQNRLYTKENLEKALGLMRGHGDDANTAEAVKMLDRIIQFNPHGDAYVVRGAAFANVGKFTRAIADFQTALTLNPDHANGRKFLVETLCAMAKNFIDLKKNDDARRAYEEALKIDPAHGPASEALKLMRPAEQSAPVVADPAPVAQVPALTPAQIKQEAFEAAEKTCEAPPPPPVPVDLNVPPPLLTVPPPGFPGMGLAFPPSALAIVERTPSDFDILGFDDTYPSQQLVEICGRYHGSHLLKTPWRSGWERLKVAFFPEAVPVNIEDFAIHLSNELGRPVILPNQTCIMPATRNCDPTIFRPPVDFSVPPPPLVAAQMPRYPPPVAMPPLGIPPPMHPIGLPPPGFPPIHAPPPQSTTNDVAGLERRDRSPRLRSSRSRRSRSRSRSLERRRRRRSRSRSRSRSRDRDRRHSRSHRRRRRSRSRSRSVDRGRRRRSRSDSRSRSRDTAKREERKTDGEIVVRYTYPEVKESDKRRSPSPRRSGRRSRSRSTSSERKMRDKISRNQKESPSKKAGEKGKLGAIPSSVTTVEKDKTSEETSMQNGQKEGASDSGEEDEEDLEKTEKIAKVLSRHLGKKVDEKNVSSKIVTKLLAELNKTSKKSKKKKKKKHTSSSSSTTTSESPFEDEADRMKIIKAPKENADEGVAVTAPAPAPALDSEVASDVEVRVPQEENEKSQPGEDVGDVGGSNVSLIRHFMQILQPDDSPATVAEHVEKRMDVPTAPAAPGSSKPRRRFEDKPTETAKEGSKEARSKFEEAPGPSKLRRRFEEKPSETEKEGPKEARRKVEEAPEPSKPRRRFEEKPSETEGEGLNDAGKKFEEAMEAKRKSVEVKEGVKKNAELKKVVTNSVEAKEVKTKETKNNVEVLLEAKRKLEEAKRNEEKHEEKLETLRKKPAGTSQRKETDEDDDDAPIFKPDGKARWKPVNAPGKVAPRAPIAINLWKPPPAPSPPPRQPSPVQVPIPGRVSCEENDHRDEPAFIIRSPPRPEPVIETTIAGAFARKAKEDAARRSGVGRVTPPPPRHKDHKARDGRRPVSRVSRPSRSRSRSRSRDRVPRRRRSRSRTRSRSRSRERYRGRRSRSRSRSRERRRRSRSRTRSRSRSRSISPFNRYHGRGGRGFRGGFRARGRGFRGY